jgi:hypothetical protein
VAICLDKISALLKNKKTDYQKIKYWLKIACTTSKEDEDLKDKLSEHCDKLQLKYPKDNKLKDIIAAGK